MKFWKVDAGDVAIDRINMSSDIIDKHLFLVKRFDPKSQYFGDKKVS